MTNKQAKEILFKYVQAVPQDCITPTFLTALNIAISVLEERLTGEWIELPRAFNQSEHTYKCSNCGHVLSFMNFYPKSNYCPNCGADMRTNFIRYRDEQMKNPIFKEEYEKCKEEFNKG